MISKEILKNERKVKGGGEKSERYAHKRTPKGNFKKFFPQLTPVVIYAYLGWNYSNNEDSDKAIFLSASALFTLKLGNSMCKSGQDLKLQMTIMSRGILSQLYFGLTCRDG